MKRQSHNTTSELPFSSSFSLPFVVFSRPYSQHLNWFLFLQVLRRFNPLRSLSFRIWREVSFGYLWFKGYMRLAKAFCSLSHPSSVFEPSHPPNNADFLCSGYCSRNTRDFLRNPSGVTERFYPFWILLEMLLHPNSFRILLPKPFWTLYIPDVYARLHHE